MRSTARRGRAVRCLRASRWYWDAGAPGLGAACLIDWSHEVRHNASPEAQAVPALGQRASVALHCAATECLATCAPSPAAPTASALRAAPCSAASGACKGGWPARWEAAADSLGRAPPPSVADIGADLTDAQTAAPFRRDAGTGERRCWDSAPTLTTPPPPPPGSGGP